MDSRYPELTRLITGHPTLECCEASLVRAVEAVCACYTADGIVLVCGNGGSAADADHIVGELMKGFQRERPLPESDILRFEQAVGPEGRQLASGLQGALRAISLSAHTALATAFANDRNPEYLFAQQVYGYGRAGDVLVGISTSGNAANVTAALLAAKAAGMISIGLSGRDGGALARHADIAIRVPADLTAAIQELHLPVYHALCAEVERRLF